MSEEPIVAARRFLALLDVAPSAATDDLESLSEALDRLALTHHQTPDPAPYQSATIEPPAHDYPATYHRIGERFPGLGYFARVVPSPDAAEITMADAIDDLADITLDLQDVLWRWEHTSRDDALWHFRFGFRTHWGRHLQNLRVYLHARLYES